MTMNGRLTVSLLMPRSMPRARTLVLVAATAAAAAGAFGCSSIPLIGRRAPEVWAFSAPWDPAGAASAARNGSRVDALVSGWMFLVSATGAPTAAFPDTAGR